MHRAFQSYGHYKGPLDKVRKGVLISMAGQTLVNSCILSEVPFVAKRNICGSLSSPCHHLMPAVLECELCMRPNCFYLPVSL